MNICLVTPALRETGVVHVVHDLAWEYERLGHSVEVVYFDTGPGMTMPSAHQITMRDWLDTSKFDIVHTHGIRSDAAVWLHRSSIQCPCVSTAHIYVRQDFLYTYGRLASIVGPYLFRVAWSRHDALVALSQDMRDYYSHHGRDRRWTYIYNGVPSSVEERPMTTDPADVDRVGEFKNHFSIMGAVGGLTARKGIDQIIRVLPDFSSYGLMVVGDGPELGNLRSLAARYGVSNRCLFLGARPNGASYMKLFDYYCLPSRSEGFPLVLLEAARAGLPVIASSLPALTEAFSSEELAFFVPDELESLKSAVQRCAAHSVAYAEKLHAKYLAQFTSTRMAQQYLNLYEKSLRG